MANRKSQPTSGLIHPAALRQRLLIDTPDGPRPYAEVAEPWQVADDEALDAGWLRAMGQHVAHARMLAYLERARGHDKTGMAAGSSLAALIGSPKPITGCWVAASKEQAQLGIRAIERRVEINDLLRGAVDVQEFRVVVKSPPRRVLDVLASDSNTTFGRTDDFVIVDELTNWPDRGEAVWQTIWSGIPKRGGRTLLLVISNAGVGAGSSWQWKIREAARTGPNWYFSSLDGPQASWITAADLAEQRRILPTLAYDRLWLNRWTSGSGDAITSEDVAAGFAAGLPMVDHVDAGWAVTIAIDGAVSRDWAAAVALGRNRAGRYRVLRCWLWKPGPGRKIDQEDIERTIVGAWKTFRPTFIAADPYQLEYLISRLQKQGVRIEARQQSGKSLVEQCLSLVSQFSSRNIDCPPFPALEYDLSHARIEQRSYGLRLVSDHGPQGHGDLLSALSIAAASLKGLPQGTGESWGGVTVTSTSGGVPWNRQYRPERRRAPFMGEPR